MMHAKAYVPAPIILEEVCVAFGLHMEELRSQERHGAAFAVARNAAALLMAERTPMSAVEIGRALGRRDPTTGRYNVMQGRTRLLEDDRFAATVRLIEARIDARFSTEPHVA
jgi:chromosomal replication initiation ATPase DnaA